jgi:putative PEP-CTERM system histidine kinase
MLTSVASLSYGISAFAYLLLAVVLMTNWRGRLFGVALTVACLITSAWSALIAYQVTSGSLVTLNSDVLEVLRNASWTIFLLFLLGPFQKSGSGTTFRLKPSTLIILLFYLVHLFATMYTNWGYTYLQGGIDFANGIVAKVGLAVAGMLLVEQYYRNTIAKERWGIKFLCLGIGGMFAYDFYMYSDAMLFRKLDTEIWAARGVVNALIVPLVAVSVARNPKWSLGISVSRSVMFHSATLFGSAIYLLIMSAAGYYLRFFGGSWGVVMQVAFLFVTVILLASILFSGSIRSWLKVFISKHFYNYNYDYREEWLRFTRTLSMDGQGLGERSIQAVAALVESPGGVLLRCKESSVLEISAHWNMPNVNVDDPHNEMFCEYLEKTQWVIDLQECAADPEKYGNIVVPQWLENNQKVWLVVPLILHGKLFGIIVLSHARSKIILNWEIIDLLKIASSQAASYLAQKESADALMVARQFESFNRMSTFVVHDLKNLISQLSLLLSNAEKHKNNPEFQKDMLETLDLSVQKMKLILHKLGRGSSEEIKQSIRVFKLLQHTVEMKAAFEPKPQLVNANTDALVLANWDRLERVIGHLIQNAIEATPKEGKVIIRIELQDDSVIVEITDTGQGMSAEFMRDCLYKPFESTKSAGMGIGVFESREYISELGGQLEVESSTSTGTTFRVILPQYEQAKDAGTAVQQQEEPIEPK